MPIPLIKLPYLVQIIIIPQLDVPLIFQLMIQNRVFRRLLARCSYPFSNVQFTSYSLGGFTLGIKAMDWTLRISVLPIGAPQEEGYSNEIWTVNKETVHASVKKDGKTLSVTIRIEKSSLRSKIEWIKFIWDTISPLLRKCTVGVEFMRLDETLEDVFFWGDFNKFSKILIHHVKTLPISTRLLAHLMANVAADVMELDVAHVARSSRYLNYRGSDDQTLKFSTIELDHSDWLRHDHFFDILHAKYIEATVPDSESINKLIKNWIQGKHIGVHEVHVNRGRSRKGIIHRGSHFNPLRPLKTHKVLSKILCEPTFCRKSSSNLQKFELPFGSVGYDIKRKDDDCMATLWLSENDLVIQMWPVDFIPTPNY